MPLRVNLRLLPTRLVSTCTSLFWSPTTVAGTSGATVVRSSRFLRRAVGSIGRSTSLSIPRRENGRRSSSKRPASSLEKSSTSLMMVNRRTAERRMSSRCSRWPGGICSPRRMLARPMMPFMGVRISWLMLARNWPLATLAASAATRACSNSRSPSLRREMSSITQTVPWARSSGLMALPLMTQGMTVPSFFLSRYSTCSTSLSIKRRM